MKIRATPADHQLKILRKLDAGAQILLTSKEGSTYAITMNDVVIQVVRVDTLHSMVINEWIAANNERGRYELTKRGRDFVDARAYIRGLVELQEAS